MLYSRDLNFHLEYVVTDDAYHQLMSANDNRGCGVSLCVAKVVLYLRYLEGQLPAEIIVGYNGSDRLKKELRAFLSRKGIQVQLDRRNKGVLLLPKVRR